MKKRILLFTVIAGMGFVVLTSESGGPAFYGATGGGNRTGAKVSVANCGGSNGALSCHGTGTSTTVTITVDSGSTPVTHYVPGHSYTIKIHGVNTSANPDYGFEFAAVSGTGAAQLQAGTFSGLATNISNDSYLGLSFIEQSRTLVGSPAGTYDVPSFTWTAPAPGVGNVTLYCTLNAVNGDGDQNAADISGNTSVVLTANTLAVGAVSNAMSISAFPNPVSGSLNVKLDDAQPGAYTLQVFNLNGSTISSQPIALNGASSTITVNTTNWTPGLYNIVVTNGASRNTMLVVKQ